jgi:MATE family multidrug resistance protein
MIATQLFVMATGFLDTAMAGNYGAADLAGVAMAGNLMWPFFMLTTGMTMALTPIVAQLRGAGSVHAAGERIRQGLWVVLPSSIFMILILWNSRFIFEASGIDPQVTRIASGYLQAVSFGMPPVLLYMALRQVSEGLGHTLPPMWIAGAIIPLNALLNYAFIFGVWGFPELGGIGAGWATAIVFWVELIAMLLVSRQRWFRATTAFSRFSPPDFTEIGKLLRIGIPIGLTFFIEMTIFSLVGFLIGRIGVTELAAHSIAGNLNWMTFVLPSALGAAAGIRVGFHVGAGDSTAARFSAVTAWRFAFVYALIAGVLLFLGRNLLVGVYTDDMDVQLTAATLLIFIAIYQLADDTQAVAAGTLRGYKDTSMPMVIGMVGYWLIALPLGVVLAEGLTGAAPLGVFGYWAGLTVGLGLVAIALGLRLLSTSNNPERIASLAHR